MPANPENKSIAAIILAAGNSSRLGQSKQLLEIQGQALLTRTMEQFEACPEVTKIIIVIGANAARIRSQIPVQAKNGLYQYVENDVWQTGMGSSIACGMQALVAGNAGVGNVIISVCDQPFLAASHLQQLISQARKHPGNIIASSYAETTGPPVLFPDAYWNDLVELTGKQGAKHILRQFKESVVTIDFPQGDIDIDTPADLDPFRT